MFKKILIVLFVFGCSSGGSRDRASAEDNVGGSGTSLSTSDSVGGNGSVTSSVGGSIGVGGSNSGTVTNTSNGNNSCPLKDTYTNTNCIPGNSECAPYMFISFKGEHIDYIEIGSVYCDYSNNHYNCDDGTIKNTTDFSTVHIGHCCSSGVNLFTLDPTNPVYCLEYSNPN
jgi:hypothetical protein